MTESRDLRSLMQQHNIPEPPEEASAAVLDALSDGGPPISMLQVDHQDVEGVGGKWVYLFADESGKRFTTDMWDNPVRDELSTYLMQLTQDGPVTGVKLAKRPYGKRPFYYFTVA